MELRGLSHSIIYIKIIASFISAIGINLFLPNISWAGCSLGGCTAQHSRGSIYRLGGRSAMVHGDIGLSHRQSEFQGVHESFPGVGRSAVNSQSSSTRVKNQGRSQSSGYAPAKIEVRRVDDRNIHTTVTAPRIRRSGVPVIRYSGSSVINSHSSSHQYGAAKEKHVPNRKDGFYKKNQVRVKPKKTNWNKKTTRAFNQRTARIKREQAARASAARFIKNKNSWQQRQNANRKRLLESRRGGTGRGAGAARSKSGRYTDGASGQAKTLLKDALSLCKKVCIRKSSRVFSKRLLQVLNNARVRPLVTLITQNIDTKKYSGSDYAKALATEYAVSTALKFIRTPQGATIAGAVLSLKGFVQYNAKFEKKFIKKNGAEALRLGQMLAPGI